VLINELAKNSAASAWYCHRYPAEADGEWYVYLNGGRVRTDARCFDWARQGVGSGAGEILLTSMNHDGTKQGFAIGYYRLLSENLPVPVIASGGGGTMAHFTDVFKNAKADAPWLPAFFTLRKLPFPN